MRNWNKLHPNKRAYLSNQVGSLIKILEDEDYKAKKK
jgi:hypothetical protein